MSNKFDSTNPEDLCVLNDVRFFDIASCRWLPSSISNGVLSDPVSDALIPKARYAHLSSVSSDRLFIIGGQDYYNVWLDDVYVYDLLGKAWVQRRDYPRRCGTYRSVAVSANLRVRLPQDEPQTTSTSALGSPGARFALDGTPSSREFTAPESLIHMPYSAPPTEDHPCDIYLYSNYNVCVLFFSLTISFVDSFFL
jgi:leucine-zipper-like transcriptional regulator 1